MNISRLQYNEKYQALEIYISGCDGKCPGCHNPELWDYTIGRSSKDQIKNRILGEKIKVPIVKYIWILGGCPLLQDIEDLEEFLKFLYKFKKPIMLWTRFYEKDIPQNIKQYLSYAKVGRYIHDSESYEEPLFGITLASSNQKIIRINND